MKTVPYIEECVKVGRISRSNNNDGAILINFTSQKTVDFKKVKFLFLNIQNKSVPFKVLSSQLKNRSGIFNLETITSELIAERYIGLDVYVIASDCSDNDGTQAPEIVGFSVLVDSKVLGEIADIIEYPMHQVFAIKSVLGKEILIPFSEDFIVSLDFNKKELHLELPEGLLDLYS